MNGPADAQQFLNNGRTINLQVKQTGHLCASKTLGNLEKLPSGPMTVSHSKIKMQPRRPDQKKGADYRDTAASGYSMDR